MQCSASLTVLSMHQPWASLLVYGLKRIEGRGWPTDHTGRLWIHATSTVPTKQDIEVLSALATVCSAEGMHYASVLQTPVPSAGDASILQTASPSRRERYHAEHPQVISHQCSAWMCQCRQLLLSKFRRDSYSMLSHHASNKSVISQ